MPQSSPALHDALGLRESLFEQMQAISRATTLHLFRQPVEIDNKKAVGFDPVTQADRGCEQALRALIEQTFPDDGIFGEEFGTVRAQADYLWIIDPIDGTRAYISGIPLWGTLVGLLHRGVPVAGLAFQPFIDEAFICRNGTALWSKDGQERALSTGACSSLASATLMTTTPALFDAGERARYDRIERRVRSVRYGTDWYAYAMIASGCCDIVIESGLSPYDILPLAALIEAAGGCVTDWQGEKLRPDQAGFSGQVLALGDPDRLPELVEALRAQPLKEVSD